MSDVKIAAAADLFRKQIVRRFKVTDDLPVLGMPVRLRSITEREYSDYQADLVASGGSGLRKDRLRDATRRFIAMCVVDGDGNPIISNEDRDKIGDWDNADAAYVYEEATRHCGIKPGEIEGLVKNSEKAPAVS